MTVSLARSMLERLLDPAVCLNALRDGFAAAPADTPDDFADRRVRTDLPGPGTATALLPGLVNGIPAYTVKVNAKFPGERPALRGIVCLHDLATGALLALLDSATVTACRTGLGAAVATHTLARAAAQTVTVIGAGVQAHLVMKGLVQLRPIRRLIVFDLDRERAETFAERHSGALGIAADVAADLRTAAGSADIVVLATWSRRPLLDAGDVAAGTHVTSLGADEPGKAELSADLLRRSRVVVDDVALAVQMGALGNAGLEADAAAGTLGEVVRGDIPGRRGEDGVTVYAPVGLPWQDLAVSWVAYRAARALDLGTRFDFLG